jgi:hypothetical protein
MKRKDSTFILVPKNDLTFDFYDEIPIKYSNSKHKLRNLGMNKDRLKNYPTLKYKSRFVSLTLNYAGQARTNKII